MQLIVTSTLSTNISISVRLDLLVDFLFLSSSPLDLSMMSLRKQIYIKGSCWAGRGALNGRIAAHSSASECSLAIPKSFFHFADKCQESCLATRWETDQPTKEERCTKSKQAEWGWGQSEALDIPLRGHLQSIHAGQRRTEKASGTNNMATTN